MGIHVALVLMEVTMYPIQPHVCGLMRSPLWTQLLFAYINRSTGQAAISTKGGAWTAFPTLFPAQLGSQRRSNLERLLVESLPIRVVLMISAPLAVGTSPRVHHHHHLHHHHHHHRLRCHRHRCRCWCCRRFVSCLCCQDSAMLRVAAARCHGRHIHTGRSWMRWHTYLHSRTQKVHWAGHSVRSLGAPANNGQAPCDRHPELHRWRAHVQLQLHNCQSPVLA